MVAAAYRQLPRAGAIFALVLLWACAGDGPDFGRYVEWGYAGVLRDIFELRGNVLSPAGVPFTVASAGPGLLFASVYQLAGQAIEFRTAAYLAGWIAAAAFWRCAFLALRGVTSGHRALPWFGVAALFVATHAGLYSHAYSTEVFAMACIAALWALTFSRLPPTLLHVLAAGSVAGLLLLVRPYLVFYAVAPLAVAVTRRTSDARPWRLLPRLALCAVPIGIAVAQHMVVNRWMTGDPLHPPYIYGGMGFRSVDLLHPQFAAVLAHPTHGLLTYHPLYAVGFAALAVESFRTRHLRLLCIATLVAVLAHLWIQASWFIWWLGGASFGMRGMAPAALPLAVALASAIAREVAAGHRSRQWWLRATVLACVWSAPLLVSGAPPTDSWSELVASQRWVLAVMAALIVLWSVGDARRQRRWAADPEWTIRLATGGAAAAAVGYLLVRVGADRHAAIAAVLAAAVAVVAAVVPRGAFRWERVAAAALLVLFTTQAVVFVQLAAATERHIASGAPPPREFKYVSTAPIDDLQMSYAEYAALRGFDEQKARFRTFLGWLHIHTTPMSPSDRRLAERVLATLATDPVAGELILRITAHDRIVAIASGDTNAEQRMRARALAGLVPGVVAVEDRMK